MTVELEPVQVPFSTVTVLPVASSERLPSIEPVVVRACQTLGFSLLSAQPPKLKVAPETEMVLVAVEVVRAS